MNNWNQRYFVNDTYFNRGSKSPVFLCVGGEGPALEPTVVIGDVHCSDMIHLAAEVGAMVVAVEHRYYGSSLPVSDFTTENLRYLSSKQALADLARFITSFYSSNVSTLSYHANTYKHRYVFCTHGISILGRTCAFIRINL